MSRKGTWRWVGVACALALVVASCSGGGDQETVAVLFVGHGEPATMADGDVPIAFADGTTFGPFAASLGVPAEMQSTEWAAAYEEIATAMTYIFPDVNQNGTEHEMMVSPAGDVPPFFTWEAFHEEAVDMYAAVGDYSPHNDLIAEHVANLDIQVDGAEVVTHLAFLDAVPRIADVMLEIGGDYDKMVVVPMLLASSTHTQEVEEQVAEAAGGGTDIVVAEPFFEAPFMRERVKSAVLSMADHIRQSVPAGVADDDLGVMLVAHGTPYSPPLPEYGYEEGDIFSNLSLTEGLFHDEIAAEWPWAVRTGRMNYAAPSIQDALAGFEADGIGHVLVVPSAFPTAAIHTMWHVADPAIGRAVTPDEGVIVHTRPSGMNVYYSAQGYADLDAGREEFRRGLGSIAEAGVLELLGGGEA